MSVEQLNVENVMEIEKYVNDHLRHIFYNMDCCNSSNYKNQKQFRFLPGHKTLILNLPSQLIKLKAAKVKTSLKNQRQQIEENLNLENDAIVDVDNLKDQLISKLVKYVKNIQLDSCADKLTVAQICECITIINDEGQLTYKCKVQCPLCNKKIGSIYKKYWYVSNVEKHFKGHSENQTETEKGNVLKEAQTNNNMTDQVLWNCNGIDQEFEPNDTLKQNLENCINLLNCDNSM